MKRSATNIPVPCSNFIKTYSQGMGDIDLVDQRTEACNFNLKSSIRFYLVFFRIDGCCLCQRLHHLQYHASKRPYPA